MNSPTLADATEAGVILGTAAYMSPEQARGKPVDERCDIWAFGVVLYEMLTGQSCFGKETVSDTVAAVLTKDPDWTRVPPPARRLLTLCLEKDPTAAAPRHRRRAVHDRRRPSRCDACTIKKDMDSLGSCRSAGSGAGVVAGPPEAAA